MTYHLRQKHFFAITLLINFLFFALGYLLLSRLDIQLFRTTIVQIGFLAPLLYIVIYTVLFIIPFNPLPKNILTYIALISFGPFLALVMTLLGDSVGILFNYFIGSRYAHFLPKRMQEQAPRFTRKNAWWLLSISRIIPVTEGFAGADIPSYAAGAVKMPKTIFFLATMIPWIIIDVIYFYGLNTLLAYSPMVIPLIILFIISTIGGLYKFVYIKRKKS